MIESDPSISLTRFYTLSEGVRVRLRLARSRDLPGIRTLLLIAGEDHAELETARLVHSDPRRRVVICATALLGGTETVVGIGAIDIGADRPDMLCVDPALLGGLPELLSGALRSRVGAIEQRSAA